MSKYYSKLQQGKGYMSCMCSVTFFTIIKKENIAIQVADICAELTTLIHECEDAMLTISRGPSPLFDNHSEREVSQLVGVADAAYLLEDVLSQKQYLKAVQLLHTIRKH